ncbi:type II toxin-antitoxin system VapB family antitoxin [Neorhizobium sp. NPDC001467]|uniref:type II toxin-antitoxin system VapB family antitoxin n=1 Tax=Neorhizobium sp. NPDC001467 TaxID=3390595 RepID=UPI003D02E6F5
MTRSVKLDDQLVNNAEKITGLSDAAAVEEALRILVKNHELGQKVEEMRGIGWHGRHHNSPSFESLAKEFRALTASRDHTPSEVLMREGRDER